jgi:hypothetical protein
MKKIKIFGLPRSGTNLTQILVPLNFKISTCLKKDFNDYLGWKHGKPHSIENYNKISEITKEEFLFLFCVREKENWKKAYLNKHKGSFEMPWEWSDQKDCFIFNTPHGPEIYKNIDEFYNDRVNSYKSFTDINPDKSYIVRYEDLFNDQIGVLKIIKDKFQLELAQENFIKINKKINWHGEIAGDII